MKKQRSLSEGALSQLASSACTPPASPASAGGAGNGGRGFGQPQHDLARTKMSRWESDDEIANASISRSFRSSLYTGAASEGPPSLRSLLRRILASPRFDLAMGAVVVTNSITIGLEQRLRLDGGDKSAIDVFEHVFLFVYLVELTMNFVVRGRESLQSYWIRFDFILVSVSVFTQWIWVPVNGHLEGVGFIMVLRTARLLRLARTLRLLMRFKELWMLAQGLISSAATMLYTTFLLIVILYIFSCIGIEMITLNPKAIGPNPDERFQDLVADHFSSLGGTMLTLVAFISFDNIVTIYKPLIELDWMLLPYFALLILVVGIVLTNLVTAVIVNSALEQAQQDRALIKTVEEAKKKRVVKDLRKIFQRLDADCSGKVSTDEIKEVDEEDLSRLADFMTIQDPVEIFNALDVDETGEIGIDEFCDGIWEVVVSNTPLEMKRMEKQVDKMQTAVKYIQQNQSFMQHQLSDIAQLLRQGGGAGGGVSPGPQHAQFGVATEDGLQRPSGHSSQESSGKRRLEMSVPDSAAETLTLPIPIRALSPAVMKVIAEPAGQGGHLAEAPLRSAWGLSLQARAGGELREEEEQASRRADCSGGQHSSADADSCEADARDLADYVHLKVLTLLTSCRELDVLFELSNTGVDAALNRALERIQSMSFAGLQSIEKPGRCAGAFQRALQQALAEIVPAEGHNEVPVPQCMPASLKALHTQLR